MAAANIDMVSRDFCAHILIKLNDCRCAPGRCAQLGWPHAAWMLHAGAEQEQSGTDLLASAPLIALSLAAVCSCRAAPRIHSRGPPAAFLAAIGGRACIHRGSDAFRCHAACCLQHLSQSWSTVCCPCRRKSLYLPWKCEHERHEYEK